MFLFTAAFLIFACVKQDFDEPPAEPTASSLTANKTIKALKAIHKLGQFEKITEDWIIAGVVVADDQSGNYYKTIVIQDETGGIDVKIDATGLYNDFPVGRKVFIKCKDLTLGDYGNLIQLGGGLFKNNSGQDQLAGIEQLLVPTFVEKGPKGQKITPRAVKISELTEDMISTLVTLQNVEFADGNADVTYADAPKKQTLNRTVTDCDKLVVFLRSSGYASFANDKTPTGNGTLTGIYSVFRTDKQFFVRDPSLDVSMKNPRCTGGGGGGPIGGTSVTIGSLRQAFAAGTTSVAAGTKISGTVISDKDGKNINAQNAVVQGEDGRGIIVRFTAAHSFAQGTKIDVNVGGGTLSLFSGTLQVTAGPTSNASSTGTSNITPNTVTLAKFTTDYDNLESTLVRIADATASTTAKFGGSVNLTDASGGKAVMYTATAATFANDALPGDVVNAVGIASKFNTTLQIQPRNAADVTKGTGTGTGGSGGTATVVPIGDIRSLFASGTTKAPANTAIKGVVISDAAAKNINAQNIVLQDIGGKGVLVRFSAVHSFQLGDEIEVDISGVTLSEYNSLLQVGNVTLANGKKTGTALVAAKTVTIADLIANFENYESTLVTINNATIPTAAKFGGALKINDGTGEIDLFTLTGALFANNVPAAGVKKITAIVSQFKSATTVGNGYQIQIRNESDIK